MTKRLQRGFEHERTDKKTSTNDWITPKSLVDVFSCDDSLYFDLDPCASVTQPWPCAKVSYTVANDGLSKVWSGNVWLNPLHGYVVYWGPHL
jgi:hypothetical protein